MNKKIKELLTEIVEEVDTLFGCDILHEDTSPDLFAYIKDAQALIKDKKKAEFKEIETTYFNGTQSVEFRGIYEYKSFKVKVHIDVDAYDMQSSARVWVYNPTSLDWKFLDSIPYKHMASLQKDDRDCEAVFYQRKVESNGSGLRYPEQLALEQDIKTLLLKVESLL